MKRKILYSGILSLFLSCLLFSDVNAQGRNNRNHNNDDVYTNRETEEDDGYSRGRNNNNCDNDRNEADEDYCYRRHHHGRSCNVPSRYGHRHHGRDNYQVVKVWVGGRWSYHHGHKVWIPGHHAYRKVYR